MPRKNRDQVENGAVEEEAVSADTAPTTDVTIAGQTFTLPNRYAEGHVITRGEAGALNQTLHENIRNNFAKRVKEASEDAEAVEALRAEIATYADNYKFGERQGGGRTTDPVRRLALDIARRSIESALRKRGEKVSDYKAKTISDRARQYVDADPRFLEAAKQQLAREAEFEGLPELPQPASPDTTASSEPATDVAA